MDEDLQVKVCMYMHKIRTYVNRKRFKHTFNKHDTHYYHITSVSIRQCAVTQ